MVSFRKIIPFALAAGMAAGTAGAQDGVDPAPVNPDADPFACEQVGWYTDCPNVAGSILVARYAVAEKDWGRAFTAATQVVVMAGLREPAEVARMAQSALMSGDERNAEIMADVAGRYQLVTPHSAVILAVQAAAREDIDGVKAALAAVPMEQQSASALYVTMLANIVEKNAAIGEDLTAQEILWYALEETEEMIRTAVDAQVMLNGEESRPLYIRYVHEAALIRGSAELLIVPGRAESWRAMALTYEAMGAKEAALTETRHIELEDMTDEDVNLRRRLLTPSLAATSPAP